LARSSGSPFELFNLDESYKRGLLRFYKILAIPSVTLAVFIFYDLVAPLRYFDKAVVVSKQKRFVEGVKRYIEAKGERFHYWEEVGKRVYEGLEPGDEVILGLSRVFKEVKTIRVCREGKCVTMSGGKEVLYMGIFGILCLATALPYFLGIRFFSRSYFLMVVASPLVGLASIVLIFKLLLLFFGVIERI